MEQFIAQNPAIGVWVIGLLGTALGAVVIWQLSRILAKFDEQNVTLARIEIEWKSAISGVRARLRSLEYATWGKAPPGLEDEA